MKVTKDAKLDVAYIKLRTGKVASTVELRPGILFDLDKNGQVLGIEVLALSQLAPLLKASGSSGPAARARRQQPGSRRQENAENRRSSTAAQRSSNR